MAILERGTKTCGEDWRVRLRDFGRDRPTQYAKIVPMAWASHLFLVLDHEI